MLVSTNDEPVRGRAAKNDVSARGQAGKSEDRHSCDAGSYGPYSETADERAWHPENVWVLAAAHGRRSTEGRTWQGSSSRRRVKKRLTCRGRIQGVFQQHECQRGF